MVKYEMKKLKKIKTNRISVEDYIKAVKKADREIQLANSAGWKRVTSIHKSKKAYDRKRDKKNFGSEE